VLQLADALDYMHSRWYIHRDLKTSNILYNNSTGQVSICDFGMARKYGSPIEPYSREVVTLWYRPPELLLGAGTYSHPLDAWSFGCIFAEILTGGKPIFPGQGEVDQINKIFSVLGAPTEDKWPGAALLPHFSKISYRVPSKSRLRELFPSFVAPGAATSGSNALGVSYSAPKSLLCLTEAGFDLLSNLLHMDPKQRFTARQAVEHRWLAEDPKPTSPDMMPKFNQRL
jgi:cell division cycle 2-like